MNEINSLLSSNSLQLQSTRFFAMFMFSFFYLLLIIFPSSHKTCSCITKHFYQKHHQGQYGQYLNCFHIFFILKINHPFLSCILFLFIVIPL